MEATGKATQGTVNGSCSTDENTTRKDDEKIRKPRKTTDSEGKKPKAASKRKRSFFSVVGRQVSTKVSTQKCICEDAVKCRELHKKIAMYDSSRAGYATIPCPPLISKSESKSGLPQDEDTFRKYRYERFLEIFPGIESQKTKKEKRKRAIARLHFHPALSAYSKDELQEGALKGERKFPKKVPAFVASRAECSEESLVPQKFWDTEGVPEYLVLPNYPRELLEEEIRVLKGIHDPLTAERVDVSDNGTSGSQSQQQHHATSRPSFQTLPKFSLEPNMLTNKTQEELIAIIDLQQNRIASLEEENRRIRGMRTVESCLRSKLKQLETRLYEQSMSRESLLDDEFHKSYPWVAKIAFGFDSWAETKSFCIKAFAVDTTSPLRRDEEARTLVNPPLSQFEELLCAKMHSKNRHTKRELACIWGKGEHIIGRLINVREKDWATVTT